MSHLNNELFTPASVLRANGKASPSTQVLALILEPQVRSASRTGTNPCERAELARRLYGARRERDNLFPSNIFADPAWDILLILYSADLAQQRLNITSVCEAAAVPSSTALRWIDNLVGYNLLRRVQHTTDGRTIWLQLTFDARTRLDRFFDGVLASPPASSAVSRIRPSLENPIV